MSLPVTLPLCLRRGNDVVSVGRNPPPADVRRRLGVRPPVAAADSDMGLSDGLPLVRPSAWRLHAGLRHPPHRNCRVNRATHKGPERSRPRALVVHVSESRHLLIARHPMATANKGQGREGEKSRFHGASLANILGPAKLHNRLGCAKRRPREP